MQSQKRRQVVIKREFQIRYAAVILLFVLLTAAVTTIIVYFAVFPYLAQMLADVYPQGRLMAVLHKANIKLLLGTSLIIPIAVWFGVALSHRIAGPWYRLESIINEVLKGGLGSEVKLRKGDELQSLATAVNQLIAHLRLAGKESSDCLNRLQESIKTLTQEVERGQATPAELKELLTGLQKIFDDLRSALKNHRLIS